MNVKLPNGKVLKNIPEGTTKQQIKDKAIAAGLASYQDFTEAPGALESAMISAGRTVEKMKHGAQELYYGATGNEKELSKLAEKEAEAERIMAPVKKAHPLASMAGGALPYFAVPYGAASKTLGTAISHAPKLANVGRAIAGSGLADSILSGAALSGLEYGSNAADGAVAGGLGYGIGKAVIGAGSRALSPTQKAGERLGMRLSPGQRTGSKAMQQVEASLDSMPFSASAGAKVKDINQSVVNRATAKAIGENAEKITIDVLDQADNRLTDIFESVAHNRKIQVDDFHDAIIREIDEVDDLLPEGMSIAHDQLVQKLTKYGDRGTATGKELRAMSSKLGTKANKLMTSPSGDRDLGWGLYRIKDAVDEKIASSLPGTERAAYNEARNQYRTMMMIKSGVNNINDAGDVAFKTMRNTLKKKDYKGYAMGRNKSDMYEALRFANAHPDIVGNSGTATRGVIPLLAAGVLGHGPEASTGDIVKNAAGALLGGNIGARYYYSDPLRYGVIPPLTRHAPEFSRQLIPWLGARGLLGQ